MLLLRRTVRFAVNTSRPGEDAGAAVVGRNTYAGSPPVRGLGRHYELTVTCRGEADPITGYFLDIKRIDDATRRTAVPAIAAACIATPWADPGYVVAEAAPLLAEHLHRETGAALHALKFHATPFASWEIEMRNTSTAVLRQRFDFAAAHRLSVPGLSDEENTRHFGKCANPNGHGHNYRFEPAVEVPVPGSADTEPVFGLADLERVADEVIVRRFDHKHLNLDTPEFAPGTGVNPSVENIAKVFFELLGPAIEAASGGNRGDGGKPGARLRSMTVWETDKTCCTYPAAAG